MLTPMRIGIIGSRGYPSTYSGYETLVRHLAPFLRDSGHEVTVYGRKMGLRYASTIVDGIRVVEAPALQTKTLSTPSAVITAGRHAAGERYSCVFAVNLASAPVLVVLQRAGTPVALNTDGLEWRRGKWGPLAKSVFFGCAALAATRLDHLVSDSKAIQDYYAMTFGASSTYIPYGAPVKEGLSADRVVAEGLEPGEYLLIVARLIPENSIDLMLDAHEAANVELPLVVVGEANYRSALATRLRDSSGSRRVRWLGHVSDQELLEQLWAHCALYLHGHSVGGTNPSLLQALGLGAPTLALDTPFNREVLEPYPGSLFRPDVQELRERIEVGLTDCGSVVAGADARQIIEGRYTWANVLEAYRVLAERVAGERAYLPPRRSEGLSARARSRGRL